MNYPEGYTFTRMGYGSGSKAKWRKKKRRVKPQPPTSMIPKPVTAYVPAGRR